MWRGASLSSASPTLTGNPSWAIRGSKTKGRGAGGGGEGGSAGREGECVGGPSQGRGANTQSPSLLHHPVKGRETGLGGVRGLPKVSGKGVAGQ